MKISVPVPRHSEAANIRHTDLLGDDMNFFANPLANSRSAFTGVTTPQTASPALPAAQPVVFEPRGPLCLSTRRNLESHLKLAIKQGHRRFVISLEHLTRFDSSGLAALISCLSFTRQEGGDLRLCCASPELKELTQRTGLSRVLRIYGSQSEAVAALLSARQPVASLSQAV